MKTYVAFLTDLSYPDETYKKTFERYDDAKDWFLSTYGPMAQADVRGDVVGVILNSTGEILASCGPDYSKLIINGDDE